MSHTSRSSAPPRVVLAGLTVDELVELAGALREVEDGAGSMEDLARRIVRRLDECLVDERGDPACVLVRLYVTHRLGDLEAELQEVAARAVGPGLSDRVVEGTRCFTLLATTGRLEAWGDRRRSAAHRAIPLVDEELVRGMPMLAGLLDQLGVDVGTVVRPRKDDVIARHHRRYDVFHVPDAAASPFVPAKDFVEQHGVRSAVGLAGVLPSGELYSLLLFSRVPVDERVAELLGSLAVTIKAGLVPHSFDVFDTGSSGAG